MVVAVPEDEVPQGVDAPAEPVAVRGIVRTDGSQVVRVVVVESEDASARGLEEDRVGSLRTVRRLERDGVLTTGGG